MSRVAVIGAGSWGMAMTGLVAPAVNEVVLWARSSQAANAMNRDRRNPNHLPDYTLAANVSATSDLALAALDVDAAVLATPSAFLRETCRNLAPHLGKDVRVLVLSKGMECGTHLLMHEVAAQELGNPARVAALSGPNHAEEICRGMVSAAVVASEDADTAAYFQGILAGPTFRAYVSDDVRGVECCGAVKNVVAIACGIASGMGMGDNTLAVLMTRGIAEIGRVVAALGGNPMTCMGLAGMGDLVVTCTSEHSRNRSFGRALVAGETLESYQTRTHMVVEGVPASVSVLELAQERGIEVPITAAVHSVLFEGRPIDDAMEGLLTRAPRTEFYGMEEREQASKENQC